jgi:YesN/AraC family two-component response regulator
MQKAKAMLLSKKYSVNQVGSEVGYSNLVNFNKAFEKTFQQLPNELIS